MARVAVRQRATKDLSDILGYLRRQAGPVVADDYRLAFQATYRRLADHPQSGVRRPGFGRGVRIVIVKPYVVIYVHDRAADMVFILRVLHGRRRLSLDAP